jgi:proline-specific peptidase
MRIARIIVTIGVALVAGCHSPAEPAEREVRLTGGSRLAYFVVGTAPDTIVVVHGGPGLDSRYLQQGLRELATHHTLVFYDQRGQGRSSAATADSLSMTQSIADLEALRAELGLSRMGLLGHHWGAGVAMLYTVAHPERVRRLALLSPMAHRASFIWELSYLPNDSLAQTRLIASRAEHRDSTDPAGFCQSFWGFTFSPVEDVHPETVRRLAPVMCNASPAQLTGRESLRRSLLRSLGNWDWTAPMGQVVTPTLVLVGTDEPALVAGARAWAVGVRDARLLQAGHSPLFPWLDAPEAVEKSLDQFFRGVWPGEAEVVTKP